MDTLKDKGVLITGGGRGIGKRLAMGFAAAGARIGLLARSKAELDLTKLEIEHAGGNAIRLRADVRDFEEVSAAVDRMRVQFGAVHVLIAAAASQGPIGPLAHTKPKAWAEAVDTNLTGVMHACLAVLPEMIHRRSGKIIVLAGGGAGFPRPNFTAYAASKAGVVRLVETLAEEVRDHNVQVNCLGPGGAYTHMTDEIIRAGKHAGQKELEQAERVRITGGVAPDKQVELAKFLASARSNHISGKFIHVDDDWKRLEKANMNPEAFTLRRVLKV
ncbi:MAG: SDR family oxidoreductase [Candidatus Solibacter usitatus]|nr:SDR family oxidoreductase [Candidatus Solibacter usitatus]